MNSLALFMLVFDNMDFSIGLFKVHGINNSVSTRIHIMDGCDDHSLNIYQTSSACNHQSTVELIRLISVVL